MRLVFRPFRRRKTRRRRHTSTARLHNKGLRTGPRGRVVFCFRRRLVAVAYGGAGNDIR